MKKVNLPWENFFGRSILISSRLQKIKENFLRLTRLSGKNCLSWLIFSIGPKRSLQPNISKKMYLLGQTKVLPISMNNEKVPNSVNNSQGSRRFCNVLCKVYGAFLGRKKWTKTVFLKKTCLTVKKNKLWPIFNKLQSMARHRNLFNIFQNDFLQFLCKSKDHLCNT